MIRLIQTKLNSPYGNCYGTSIFSIFELDPKFMPLLPENDEEVIQHHLRGCEKPETCHYTIEDKRNEYWHWMWDKFFKENNLTKISIEYSKLPGYAWQGIKAYHIINGRSPRDPEGNRGSDGRAMLHSVVGYSGLIWHDPHPSGTGLLSIDSFEYIVPADPAKPVLEGYKKLVDSAASGEIQSS